MRKSILHFILIFAICPSLSGQGVSKSFLINEYIKSCNPESNSAFQAANRGFDVLAARVGNYHQKALNHFNKAINLDSLYCDAYFLAGSMHSFLGDQDKSIELAQQSLKIKNNPSAWITIGNARLMLGQYEAAIQDFYKAIQLAPQVTDGYYGQALAHYYLGTYENAIESIAEAREKAGSIVPYNLWKIDILEGKAHFNLDNKVKAFSLLEARKGKLTKDPAGSYYLGKIYLVNGNIKRASKYIMQAKDLDYPIEPEILKEIE